MVSADEVAAQLGEVMQRDVKAFAVPRAGDSVNAGWMDLGVQGTEHVAGTTRARDVFAAAQQAVTA